MLVAGTHIVLDLFDISDSDVDRYLVVCEFLEMDAETPIEDFLDYRDIEQAIKDYIDVAQWLTFNEIPERLNVFETLVEMTIGYEFGDCIAEFDCYDPEDFYELRGLIEFFASWLYLDKEDTHAIASEIQSNF
jgi:hypothetical protein